MRFSIILIAASLFATPALADCPEGTTPILSCTFANGAKVLDACHDGATATYAFGKAGRAPDLVIETPLTELAYTPWPGIGSAIWDEVGFFNAGIEYHLWQNFDRSPSDAEGTVLVSAGIVVLKGEEELARLNCDTASITPAVDGLWDVFDARGLCFESETQQWQRCK